MLGRDILGALGVWGITRVSLDWRTPGVRDVLDAVEGLGWEVNLYGVPDLESFLEAALLLPASVHCRLRLPRVEPGRAESERRRPRDRRPSDLTAARRRRDGDGGSDRRVNRHPAAVEEP